MFAISAEEGRVEKRKGNRPVRKILSLRLWSTLAIVLGALVVFLQVGKVRRSERESEGNLCKK